MSNILSSDLISCVTWAFNIIIVLIYYKILSYIFIILLIYSIWYYSPILSFIKLYLCVCILNNVHEGTVPNCNDLK